MSHAVRVTTSLKFCFQGTSYYLRTPFSGSYVCMHKRPGRGEKKEQKDKVRNPLEETWRDGSNTWSVGTGRASSSPPPSTSSSDSDRSPLPNLARLALAACARCPCRCRYPWYASSSASSWSASYRLHHIMLFSFLGTRSLLSWVSTFLCLLMVRLIPPAVSNWLW